jgi:multiple sugar transport system substrate-binding protein
MRRLADLVALLAVLAAVATLTAACGGGGSGGDITVLKVIMTDDWVRTPYNDAVREFERSHPDVRVETEKGPIRAMTDAVRAGISSGSPPDVVQGHAVTGAGQGLAEPVDDLWAKHKLTPEEYLPGAVEDVTWGGRRYGLPLDSNAMALLYNVDHFQAAGVSAPNPNMTFGEFEALARALTSPDGTRRALVVPVDSWATYGWMKANGGETVRINPDGRPQFSIDHPANVATLSYLRRLIDMGLAFGPTGPDARSTDAYALFRSGSVSMLASGSWDMVSIQRDVPTGRFGVALMPRGLTGTTQGTAMGGSSLWISRGSKNRELAFDFMMLLTSDKYALRFAKEEGRLPVRPRLLRDEFFQSPQLRVFTEQLATAHPPILGALHEAAQAFDLALNQVLREGADPRTALVQAQSRAVASVGPS